MPRSRFAVCLFAITLITGPALADVVWPGSGIPVRDTTIQGFAGDQLEYRNKAGVTLREPLAGLIAVELDGQDQLNEAALVLRDLARDRAEDADLRKAAAALRTAARTGRPAWVKQYAQAKLAVVQDAMKDPSAVDTYLDLAKSKPPAGLLARPPLSAAAAMSDPQRAAAAAAAEGLAAGVPDDAKDAFARLTEALKSGGAVDASAVGEGGADADTTAGAAGTDDPAPDADDLAVEQLPFELPAMLLADPVAKLLKGRAYGDVIAQAGDDAKGLYLKGTAQVREGLAVGNTRGMLDGGVTLMRVVAEHRDSPFAGPALVETAALYKALDKAPKAAGLIEKAKPMLGPAGEAYQAYAASIVGEGG